ncbi:MAG: LCP family protein [bacterium]|nr:LCP family protein [bacterium]
MSSKRRSILIIGLVLLAALTAITTVVLGSYRRSVVTANPPVSTQLATPEPTPDPLQPYAFLLLGYAGGSHAGSSLTDTMMVAHVNPKTKVVSLISLPRDLWIGLPTSEDQKTNWKINAAYAIGNDDAQYRNKPAQFTGPAGGGEMAKSAVSEVVGFPLQNFVAINFAGFESTIDTLGGVSVTVDRTFDDYVYPITGSEQDTCGKSPEEMTASATFSAEQAEKEFPCRYEHLHFDKGKTTMDGEMALKFVRSRHSSQDGNDFGRAARQRNLLMALKAKVLDVTFVPRLLPLMPRLAGYVKTDINISDTRDLLELKDELESYRIKTIAMTDKNILQFSRSTTGQYILIPRAGQDEWSSVHEWLQAEIASVSADTPENTE